MLLSQLFTKTRKEAPKDEVAKNVALLTRAGFVDKLSAGIYTYLPLGLRVLKNIEAIVRLEMNALGAQEILMPALHPKENWQISGRWESMDDLYTLKDSSDREFALGSTHEEIIVPLVKQFISSYKDLPFAVYQFQSKFRMERRAKSGLLRGREFIMKDMYSFHTNEEDLQEYYEKVKGAYVRIFNTVGIGEKTYITYASGGTFSKYSHEFQTVTDAGEDTVFVCLPCSIAVNKEIIDDQSTCPACEKKDLVEQKAIEVGNIFELKTKFSEAFKLTHKDKDGKEQLPLMGCYGIGLGRLMGTIVEVLSDEKGLVWPRSVAPFQVYLLSLSTEDPRVKKEADELYDLLTKEGVEVLYDDREVSAGVKFADSELIGIPQSIVLSKTLIGKNMVEVKNRETGETKEIDKEKLLNLLRSDFRPVEV